MFDKPEYETETFKSLILPAGVIEGVSFYDCTFADCQFVEASFKGSSFIACTFTNCDLSMANVTDTEFTDARLIDTVAVGVNWSLLAQNPHLGAGLDFSGSTLKYSVFNGLDLRGRSFANCQLIEVDYSEARLAGADFGGAELQAAVFTNCDLTNANFVGAKDYQISVLTNRVKGAKFAFPEVIGLLTGLGIELET